MRSAAARLVKSLDAEMERDLLRSLCRLRCDACASVISVRSNVIVCHRWDCQRTGICAIVLHRSNDDLARNTHNADKMLTRA